MDTPVKPDPGAGVGDSGVVTPYETGNRGGDGDWAGRNLGPNSPDWQMTNRKNKAGTGRPWNKPWEDRTNREDLSTNQVAKEN